MAQEPTISGLLELPAELRNFIWELVFARDPESTQVPFDAVAPPAAPQKALLLANHQIYHETRAMNREAYRSFWNSSVFTLSTGDFSTAISNVEASATDDLQHIRHILFKSRTTYSSRLTTSIDLKCEMLGYRGVWKLGGVFKFPSARADEIATQHVLLRKHQGGVLSMAPLRFGSLEEANKACSELSEFRSVKEQMLAILGMISRVHMYLR